jgi:thiaminase/transcriptional activator TenA
MTGHPIPGSSRLRRGQADAFSDRLKAGVAAEWRAAHENHPFVVAMGDGTLSLARFRYYMKQDYLFLIDYCRVLGIACARAPALESMSWWARLLNETLNSEMALHRSFCADFGVTAADLEATEPSPATAAYTAHLVRTAYEDSAAVIAAALLPCQWGYDEIGQRLSRRVRGSADSFHARWVNAYASAEYHELTLWLRTFVDRLGGAAGESERRRIERAFRTSTEMERLFWDAAWDSETAT